VVTELSELVGQRSAMATHCQTKNISAHPSISISTVTVGLRAAPKMAGGAEFGAPQASGALKLGLKANVSGISRCTGLLMLTGQTPWNSG